MADPLATFVVVLPDGERDLRAHEADVRKITCDALRAIQTVRVVSDVTIAFESGTRVIPEIGLNGLSLGNRIKVIVDVSQPGWLSSLAEHLPSLLAHELCHQVRLRIAVGAVDPTVPPPPGGEAQAVAAFMAWSRGRPPTLGDFVIHEGFADRFAMEVFGGGPFPWDEALVNEELQHWIEYVLEHWEDTDYDLTAWVIGSSEIPRQAAYSVGFRLVTDYLASHDGIRASSLMTAPAETFRPRD